MEPLTNKSAFDPCSIFPARIKDRVFTASPLINGGITRGATDIAGGHARIPIGNNFYDRTVRAHEALHAIYSKMPPDGHKLSMLDQALEDARIHTLAEFSGCTREDELAFAKHDLQKGTSKKHKDAPTELKALIALRAAAVLFSHPNAPDASVALLKKLCASIAPNYYEEMLTALEQIQSGAAEQFGSKMKKAERLLAPFFGKPKDNPQPQPQPQPQSEPQPSSGGESESESESEQDENQDESSESESEDESEDEDSESEDESEPESEDEDESETEYDIPDAIDESETFPSAGEVKSKEDKEAEQPVEREKDPIETIQYDKVESRLTTDAADLLSGSTIGDIGRDPNMPVMYIHPLYAHDMVSTVIGEESDKNVRSGFRIDAKRLAMVVGNPNTKVFTKEAHYNGGTVLIDASGSMNLTLEALQKIIDAAPVATIGFYNGERMRGNLWIYAYKMRRAVDLSKVLYDGSQYSWSGGNVVDFAALQWLLQQQAPRLFFTDFGFCGGSYTSTMAARELFENAVARKKIIHATSFEQLTALLRNGGVAK